MSKDFLRSWITHRPCKKIIIIKFSMIYIPFQESHLNSKKKKRFYHKGIWKYFLLTQTIIDNVFLNTFMEMLIYYTQDYWLALISFQLLPLDKLNYSQEETLIKYICHASNYNKVIHHSLSEFYSRKTAAFLSLLKNLLSLLLKIWQTFWTCLKVLPN